MTFKVLFSNIGYAKGINGSLKHHIGYFMRHLYISRLTQQNVLAQLKSIIASKKPDLCCFVEIDVGSFHSSGLNQISTLLDDEYIFYDSADKYGPESALGRLPFHVGKCNGFIAKTDLPFDRLYLASGSKRLLYSILLPDGIRLFFAHFSLLRKVRMKQFEELRKILNNSTGEVIILADFNIMHGFFELAPLLHNMDLKVINREDEHTFRFHRHHMALDLCLCSHSLASRINLTIIPQPFSDHDALIIGIEAIS